MDWGSVLIFLALLIAVVLILIQPFFDHPVKQELIQQNSDPNKYNPDRLRLKDSQKRILAAFQDLETRYDLKKISDAEYEDQRSELLNEGEDVLKSLQAAGLPVSDKPEVSPSAVFSITAGSERRLPSFEEDDLETLIMNYRHSRDEKAVGFCPHCKKAVKKNDRYCGYCGLLIEKDKLLKSL